VDKETKRRKRRRETYGWVGTKGIANGYGGYKVWVRWERRGY
jgi:hypothetical protein